MSRVLYAGRSLFASVVLIAFAAFASNTQAAPINYGDFSDVPPGGVMYLDVTESSATDPTPLFHGPTITGDILDFDPKGFAAFAGSGGSDLTDGQLNFTIMALPGAAVTSLMITESGDYSLIGTGSAATQVSAGVSILVTVLEVDGVALASPITGNASASLGANLVSNPGVLSPWNLALNFDFGGLLASRNIDANLGVTKAEIVIDNLLGVISESQTTALIAKKNFTLTAFIDGNPIPEPASFALFALGTACVFRRGNR